LGLSIALAFSASTRANLPESTQRSLYLFVTAFLFVWNLVGSFILLSMLGTLNQWVGYY
jgi:hypothetical protein